MGLSLKNLYNGVIGQLPDGSVIEGGKIELVHRFEDKYEFGQNVQRNTGHTRLTIEIEYFDPEAVEDDQRPAYLTRAEIEQAREELSQWEADNGED